VRTTRAGVAVVRAWAAASEGEPSGTVYWLIVDEAGHPAVMDVRVDGSWILGGRRGELVSLYHRSGQDFDAFLDDLESRPATQADCR
jgi:hypothetical protein